MCSGKYYDVLPDRSHFALASVGCGSCSAGINWKFGKSDDDRRFRETIVRHNPRSSLDCYEMSSTVTGHRGTNLSPLSVECLGVLQSTYAAVVILGLELSLNNLNPIILSLPPLPPLASSLSHNPLLLHNFTGPLRHLLDPVLHA